MSQTQRILKSKHVPARVFDKVFMSFGWFKVNNELPLELGATVAEDGTIFTDADCRVLDGQGGAPLDRFYAIGDIRHETWDQIPSAWADGETAAIHAWAKWL
jgi:thioredoxin reductase|tara:strand:+ start:8081 stop:8386 length:306 start_codon:yes stop_codon:yes gene_type:complete